MKQKKLVIGLAMGLLIFSAKPAFANAPVFDAVNAALSELRNAIMQSQFAQDIALATERLQQLKAQYLEIVRFNSGFDDFLRVFSGDGTLNLYRDGNQSLKNIFSDFGWITPQIELMKFSSNPGDIRYSLEMITGKIPVSEDRPYIPFDEMHVVEGFQLAQEIRSAGNKTREAVQDFSTQAKTASPKGAARLQVEALSHVLLLSQQSQETMAKLIELQAVQVEQVSREEKRLESERLKYLEDAQIYLDIAMKGSYAS